VVRIRLATRRARTIARSTKQALAEPRPPSAAAHAPAPNEHQVTPRTTGPVCCWPRWASPGGPPRWAGSRAERHRGPPFGVWGGVSDERVHSSTSHIPDPHYDPQKQQAHGRAHTHTLTLTLTLTHTHTHTHTRARAHTHARTQTRTHTHPHAPARTGP